MLEIVINANNAHKDTNQMQCKEDVIELSQLAHALKSMIKVDINVLNVHHIKLPLIIIVNVLQLLAQIHFKFLETHQIAINVEIVRVDLSQII